MLPLSSDLVLDASVLALAVLWDVRFGEAKRFHPVAGLGRLIAVGERLAPKEGRARPFIYGLGMALVIPGALALATAALSHGLRSAGVLAYLVGGAYLLKSSFAVGELGRVARCVAADLDAGRLDAARQQLTSLVSRDTSGLSAELMAAAAVESVAENTTDSFVAPWLAFAVFGLAGAAAYRAINTLDSMIGYHGRYEYLGRAAARLDDAVNWLPARLAALMLVAAAQRVESSTAIDGRGDAAQAWRTMRRDHARTASPNAGWTMSAMAGALGVELEKVGHYRLGRRLDSASVATHAVRPADIAAAVGLMYGVAGLSLVLAMLCLAVRHAIVAA